MSAEAREKRLEQYLKGKTGNVIIPAALLGLLSEKAQARCKKRKKKRINGKITT